MDSYTNNTNAQASATPRPLRPMAQFRVMARHRDHSLSLVTLAENGRQAVNLAREFCDRIATASNGIALVRVEEWIGTLTEGEWKPVSLWHGGFSHRFAAQSRSVTPGTATSPARRCPEPATRCECVLLGKKTRKGGWKAKLLQTRNRRSDHEQQRTCPSRPSRAKRSCSASDRSAMTASGSSSDGTKPTIRSAVEIQRK